MNSEMLLPATAFVAGTENFVDFVVSNGAQSGDFMGLRVQVVNATAQ